MVGPHPSHTKSCRSTGPRTRRLPPDTAELSVEPALASKVVNHDVAAASDPGWVVRRSSGSAATFHDRNPAHDRSPAWATPPPPGTPGEIWVHRVEQPALVLGSTQPEELIDVAAATTAGWEVCRRHSGGGLVVVSPGDQVWVDFVLPCRHPLWDDDVHRAFDWVGRAWIDTLSSLGIPTDEPHHGPLLDRDAGRLLCFAGLGPGEITSNGSKIVGLSQRRSRYAARFQTMLLFREDRATIEPFARGPLADLLTRGALRPSGFPPNVAIPSSRAVLDALAATFSNGMISPT